MSGAGGKRSRETLNAASSPGARQALRLEAVPVSAEPSLQRELLNCIFGGAKYDPGRYLSGRRQLPGPLATTLERKSLSQYVCKHVYWVCEKSDGERRMLLAINGKEGITKTVLFDRSFSAQTLSGAGASQIGCEAEYAAMLAPTKGTCTLLDGELVESPPGSGRKVYLVFDVVSYCDARVGDSVLSKRLECIVHKVRGPCKLADARRARMGLPLLPLELISKCFQRAYATAHICQHIQAVPHAAVKGGTTSAAPKTGSTAGGTAVGAAPASVATPGAGAEQTTGSEGPPPAKRARPDHPDPAAKPDTTGTEASRPSPPADPVTAAVRQAEDLMSAGGHVRVYREGSRHNVNDGLVFTPEHVSYLQVLQWQALNLPPILKWKPLLENTVDFAAQTGAIARAAGKARSAASSAGASSSGSGPHTIPLSVAVKGGTDAIAECTIGDRLALALEQVCRALGTDSIIIECAMDVSAEVAKSGGGPPGEHSIAARLAAQCMQAGAFWKKWKPMRLRPAKTRPNFVTVAQHTQQCIAENLTEKGVIQAVVAARKAELEARQRAGAAAAGGGGGGASRSSGARAHNGAAGPSRDASGAIAAGGGAPGARGESADRKPGGT